MLTDAPHTLLRLSKDNIEKIYDGIVASGDRVAFGKFIDRLCQEEQDILLEIQNKRKKGG